MKKYFVFIFALFALCLGAFAQFDATQFEIIQSQPPYSIVQTGATAISYTNGPVFIGGRRGISFFNLDWSQNGLTNGGTSAKAFTVLVQESNDGSTWSTVGNASTGEVTAITNFYAGTYSSTNKTILMGAYTTATPSTAGFAGTYFTQEPFTNSLAGEISTAASGTYSAALKMQGMKRFLRTVYTVGGSNNVYTVSGILITPRP